MSDATTVGDPSLEPSAARPAPALAGKASDLDALRTAVVDAAGVSAGLWVSYLFALFYLLVAAGGVTHRDLFFASPIKLPFLGVDLPLEGFFWLGPALFLIVHAYVLLHFVLLASKVRVFDQELRAQVDDADVRARLRRQLPSNIFVQFLAGPTEVRRGPVGALLRLIAWISLVIGPVVLLVFFQLQFLPYHHEAITWWQRIAVVIDLALLWTLWPGIVGGRTIRASWPKDGWSTPSILTGVTLASFLMAFAVATFPGEWLEQYLPVIPLREQLVDGEVDLMARRPTSVWSNRLVLPGLDVLAHLKIDGEAKLADVTETVSLRKRQLEGVVLIDAKLTKADFTGAFLQSAQLTGAKLQGARFDRSQLSFATLDRADLQGANLDHANLKYARMNGAQLQKASLNQATLQRARLDGAQLQGAKLTNAELQGARFLGADLRGANLNSAQLTGALLSAALLQGASLDGAMLQGAFLGNAKLQGVSLSTADLQGASLRDAKLQGASLDGARLDGSSLIGAQLQGASLDRAPVWRAESSNATVKATNVRDIVINPKEACQRSDVRCDAAIEIFNKLREQVEEAVSGTPWATESLKAIDRLDPTKPLADEREIQRRWTELQRSSPKLAVHEAEQDEQWRAAGCATEGAPFVLQGLLPRMTGFEDQRAARLAAGFLAPECTGARRLPEEAKEALQGLRDRALQPAAARQQ